MLSFEEFKKLKEQNGGVAPTGQKKQGSEKKSGGSTGVMTFEEWKEHKKQQAQQAQPPAPRQSNTQIVANARKSLQTHQAENQQKWDEWQRKYAEALASAVAPESEVQSRETGMTPARDLLQNNGIGYRTKAMEQAERFITEKQEQEQLQTLLNEAQGTMASTYAAAGQNSAPQTDTKEAQLRAIRDYYKNLHDAQVSQKIMDADLAELETWTDEEREALTIYVNFRQNGITSGGYAVPAYEAYGMLAAKYGAEKVNQLAYSWQRDQNEKAAKALKESSADAVRGITGASILHSAATVAANLLGSVTGVHGTLVDLATRDKRYPTLDPNNVGNMPNVYSGAVRGQVAENIAGDQYDENGNLIKDGGGLRQVASYAYQGLMSSADSLARAALGSGSKALSLGLAATGSFGQTVSDASERGATPGQAVILGVINGGMEVVTEYLPLDEILKVAKGGPVSGKQLMKNIFKQAAIEVTEEEVSFLGSLAAEAAVLQEKSGYRQKIAEAVASGASYEDARDKANWDIVLEAAETAITSAFSGGISAGVSSGAANINNRAAEKAAKQKTINPDAHVELADPTVDFERETWDLCDRLAKATGRNIKLYHNLGTEAGIENGCFEDGVIYVNTESGDPVAQIISHELTHSVEFAQEYKELSRLVLGRIEALGGDLKQLRQEKADLYARNGHPLGSQQEIDQEIVAEYVAQNLLTNEQQIMEAARQNRTLIEKIKGWIDNLLSAIGNKDAAERAYLTKVQNLYAKALQQTQNGPQQTAAQAAPVAVQTPVGGIQEQGAVQENADGMEDDEAPNWDDLVQARAWAQNMLSSGQITNEEFNGYIDLAEQMAEEKSGQETYTEKTEKRKHSFAGPNAKTANSQTLAEAKELDEAGVANETIRQQTGWFKGMDGKWRFEVDDSSSRISEDVSNYMTLGELLKDAEILKAYPNMEDVSVVFQSLPKGVNASYSPQFDTIDVNYNLKSDPEAIRAAVLHEIQHVIQRWEGFTKGTTVGSWDRKIKAGFDSRRGADIRKARETEQEIRRIQKEEPEFYRDMMELNAMLPDMPRGEVDWDTLEQITEDPPEWQAFDARRDQLQETYGDMRVWDFMDLLHQQEKAAENEGRSATELYWDTAGEIEARNTAGRRNLTAEERKNTPPMLGDEDTVFAEETGISLDQDISEYPYDMQTVIQEYIDSVDEEILAFVDEVQNGNAWPSKKVDVGSVNGRMANEIFKLTNLENTEGNPIVLNTGAVEHIIKRHGANGQADRSMQNSRDIARINYVLQNFDSAELSNKKSYGYRNRNGEPSHNIVFSKKINGTYFVVEAVPDTGKTGIVSAFISKKGASQVLDDNAPSSDVRNVPASTPRDIVTSGNSDVKRQMSLSPSVNRKNVADDLRGILSRGGDVAELRRYISQLEQGGGNTERTGRNAYQSGTSAEQSESQRIINMAKRYGISVEEYLRRNWEQYEVDGQWNEAARKALDMERRGRRYSVSETEELAEQKTAEQIRQEMPAKARNYLQGAQRKLLTLLYDKLGVNRFTNREDLQGIITEVADSYLTTGRVEDGKMGELFDRAYAGGIVKDAEFYEQYKEIKTHLQKTAVTISEGDSHDIADFQDFRRRNWGALRIVKQGGLPVDSAYHELNEMAPELFPESITHPADQLMRMAEVSRSIQVSEKNLNEYHGPDRETFRSWARNDFENAVAEVLGDFQQVKRYIEGQEDTEEAAPTTPEEAAQYYKQLKDARRTYERAQAQNLLTPQDEMQVGKLLRGEITLEDLNPEKDFVKGITAVYEGKKEYERLCKLLAEYKRTVRGAYREKADTYLETANEWKDKKIGLAYSRETMERNIDDIVPDRDIAAAIKREYFEAVHVSEAEATRFKTEFRNRIRGLKLSPKIQKGNLVSEAHAVQLLGEAEDNIRVLQQAKGRMKVRDGKTLEEWRSVIREMWDQSPELDQAKIRSAVEEFRKIYDELFEKMNAVRIRNGYEPVNYRQGYFPHFQPGQGDGILGAFGKALNIDTQVAALPTTINGLTHTFKPGIQWFGNAQERLGFNTAYDAVEGFDKYIEGVASVIYQTENIQKLRALATQIRYRTSEDGIRRQVDAIRARDNLSEEEKQVQINSIYEHGKYTLSNFVNELDEYTNLLANKKSKLDRTMEAMMGRKAYMVMKAWEARGGANMIAGNLSSALTNFIPLTQAGAQLDKFSLIKGMAATLKAYKEDDGIVGMSTFLTNRRGSDPLVQTWVQRASKVMGTPMELIDGFTSDAIVRAAYFQNLKRGMSEAEAMHQADVFASHVMADRSKGSMPTLFESKNPLFKAFTQFQLEVNNQFSEVFKDLPRGHRERGLAALTLVLLKYFLGAFLFNEIYEYFVGRRAALDPIGILNDTVGDLTGYELPNLVEWGTNAIRGEETSFRTEKVGIGEAGTNLTSTLLGELPFSAGLTLVGIETDGGRIPASSAVPDLTALWDAATTEGWSAEKRWKEIQDELNKLSYVIPPFGGNQAGKLIKGAKAFAKGGSYSVDAEGNDILQYPVYKNAPGDAIGNAVRMGIFGKSALPEAQDWVESGFDSLNAKQTAAYQSMIELGADDRESFTVIREMEKTNELKGNEKRMAQQAVLAEAALTDGEKKLIVGLVLGTEMVTESGNPSQYAKFLSAADRGLSVDDFMAMRTKGVDVEEYLEATDAGLNSDAAVELAYAMYDLDEKDDAEDAEYWRTCIKQSDNEYTQLALMGAYMSDDTFKKATMAYELDVTPDMFVTYYETRGKYDADGNGNYTNAEVKAVIDAMKGCTNEQKGILWQMATGSTSTKNNPYSKEAGQKWLDEKDAAKEKG